MGLSPKTVIIIVDGEFLDHLLNVFNDEDTLLVNVKIEELYLTYDTNTEELQIDYDLRYDFMNNSMDLMDLECINGRHV